MPRHVWTAADRKTKSIVMKRAWRKRKRLASLTQTTDTVMNGSLVEQRIVLHLQGQTIDIPLTDVVALRDALNRIAPKAE